MKQRTARVPLLIATMAWLASCASSDTRPTKDDTETSVTRIDGGVEVPDDGLGEIPGWRMAWVVQAGGADNFDVLGDHAWDSAVDDVGNLYLTGHLYSETAAFGAGTPSEIVLNPYEVGCIFTARYAAGGEPCWVSTIDTDLYETRAMARNDKGLIVVGRLEHGLTTFGSEEQNEMSVELACTYCPFAAQYTADGQFVWALVPDASGDSRAYILDVAATGENTICAVGNWTKGAFSFGNGIDLVPPADGRSDGFLLSLNADGSVRWMRRFTGPDETGFDAVAALADGGCVVLGHYESQATYETNDGGSEMVSGPASYRMELAHYDRDGVLIWHRDVGLDGKNMANVLEGSTSAGIEDSGLRVVEDLIAVTSGFNGAFYLGNRQIMTLGETSGGFFALFNRDGVRQWVTAMLSNGLTENYLLRKPNAFLGPADKLPDGTWLTGGLISGERRLAAGQPEEVLLDATWHNDGLLAGWSDEGRLLWWRELSGKNEVYNLTGTQVWVSSIARSGQSLYVTGGFTGAVRFGARSSDAKVLTSWGSFDIFLMKLVPLDGPQ